MIRFPKMHVAKSTVNRILNVADELDRQEITKPDISIPSLPQPDPSGDAIEVAVNTPPEPVSAPPGMNAQDVLGPGSILDRKSVV